jgi:hypothetical protein
MKVTRRLYNKDLMKSVFDAEYSNMTEIKFDNEADLIAAIKKSKNYDEFKSLRLTNKISREREAWDILSNNQGRYSVELINQFFDTVDYFETNKRWFGQMLGQPNRNLIFESSMEEITGWIRAILAEDVDIKNRFNKCNKEIRIKGANKGLTSLLLYLSSPSQYNIWVNKTQEGLYCLDRLEDLKGSDFGANYLKFNQAAIAFRNENEFQPFEVDWWLTFIAVNVESDGNFFVVDESALTEGYIPTVDDESDLDDIVGEPMELRVMRWTPTNEMGVVALFIEFRKDLGFPFVEIIRTRFPDAVVFENSPKGYIRRNIEFEFRSSGYKSHLKSKRKCHYVVCWEHNWKECPLPVFELKTLIPRILSDQKPDG